MVRCGAYMRRKGGGYRQGLAAGEDKFKETRKMSGNFIFGRGFFREKKRGEKRVIGSLRSFFLYALRGALTIIPIEQADAVITTTMVLSQPR